IHMPFWSGGSTTSGTYAWRSRKYRRTSENQMWVRGASSMIGRSLAIASSTGRRRAKPRSVVSYVNFAATKGFTSILAVNKAPPAQAATPGHDDDSGGTRKNSDG